MIEVAPEVVIQKLKEAHQWVSSTLDAPLERGGVTGLPRLALLKGLWCIEDAIGYEVHSR